MKETWFPMKRDLHTKPKTKWKKTGQEEAEDAEDAKDAVSRMCSEIKCVKRDP